MSATMLRIGIRAGVIDTQGFMFTGLILTAANVHEAGASQTALQSFKVVTEFVAVA